MKRLLLTIALTIALIIATSAHAENGGGNSADNGGNELALRFTRVGHQILVALRQLSPSEAILDLPQLERLQMALISTRVDPIRGPLQDNTGRNVDARFVIVENKGVIQLDQDHWKTILGDSETSYRLVLHEYLRATNINDDNYRISVQLESGTVHDILNGKVVTNPKNIASLDLFDQLGEYFQVAGQPMMKDLTGRRRPGLCVTKSRWWNVTWMTAKTDSGPLFPDAVLVSVVRPLRSGLATTQFQFNSAQLVSRNDSLYYADYITVEGRTPNEVYIRSKNGNIFLDVLRTAPSPNYPVTELHTRCYFWKP